MNTNKLQRLINEAVAKEVNNYKKYQATRKIVENMVRKTLASVMNEETKATQVRQALNDPSINKSGLARKIDGLSGNDDTRRSEISKIARGEWTPDTTIQNDILHTIASDTE